MKTEAAELLFTGRGAFRKWLTEHAATSGGVWLIFGKTKEVAALSANEAPEEALFFGWVDGQIKPIDHTKYCKCFARRRAKSPWSDKNKIPLRCCTIGGLWRSRANGLCAPP